jgi:aminopeptidase N
MNTQLQKLIEEMKADFEKAKEGNFDCWRLEKENEILIHFEYAKAFEKHIQKLTKILNEGSVAASNNVDNEFAKGWANRPC